MMRFSDKAQPWTRRAPGRASHLLSTRVLRVGMVMRSRGRKVECRTTRSKLPRPGAHPEITMRTLSLAGYVACIRRGDWQGVVELMLLSANKLTKIGGDFLIRPDNTIQLPCVERRSPLGWLHIAELVAAHAIERGVRRLEPNRNALSRARSIRRSSKFTDWSMCGRTLPNAKPSIASSSTGYFMARLQPTRLPTFRRPLSA